MALKLRMDARQKEETEGDDRAQGLKYEEIRSRMVYDPESKVLDFSNR